MHTNGSFILYLIRKIWSCEALFWYYTFWIIEFLFHTKLQHQQIFKLRGRTSNAIWANTITILHSIQSWTGYCTFKRTVWNCGSNHWKNLRYLCLRDFASWEWRWSLAQTSCLWNSSEFAKTPRLSKVARFFLVILARFWMQHAHCNWLKPWAMNKGSSNQPL